MSVEGRAVKRQKVSNGGEANKSTRQGIFAPYRTIGLVSTTSVPFTSTAVGKTTFQITTSTGHSLQTYDIRKGLHLNFITRPQTPELITASIAWKEKVIAAWSGESPENERGVWIYKRGKKIGELELPGGLDEPVNQFSVFGNWIVGLCDTRALVWKAESHELYTQLRGISPVPFSGAIAAVPTFLNKILVGREDGSVEIWNVSSGKLIYTILPPSTSYGAVTAIEPTPALSLAALAYSNGILIIHDIKADQSVIVLNTGEGNPVTSITFRTDGMGAGDDGGRPGTMATASIMSGDITLWDLNDGGRRAGVLRTAHLHATTHVQGGVNKVQFLSGQAILVSSGLDNSLKTWILDETPFSPVPRVLHQRSGHGADITKLQFLPTNSDGSEDTGKWLMSSSQDRSLWAWSLRRDAQSAELSQGAVQSKARKQGLLAAGNQDVYQDLKCPPVAGIACSLNRDGGIGALPGKQPIWQNSRSKQLDAEASAMTGWESVVTAHEGDSKARTWFWGRRRAGRWAFPTTDNGEVSSVAMSPCGTFALIGSKKGSIDMFNLQSGQHRQHFPARLTPMQAKQLKLDVVKHKLREESDGKRTFFRGQGRHSHAVVGLAVDEMNKSVVSAGSDGKVKFWDFSSGLLTHELDWSASAHILDLVLHRGANLIAFICSDVCIRVVDISTYKLIRQLQIPVQVISELQHLPLQSCILSSDAHWVVASIGQLIVVWDLSTGHLIDAMKLRDHCTSLDMSPTGEYLAAAIRGSVGIEIWSNKSLFSYTPARHLDYSQVLDVLHGNAIEAIDVEDADLLDSDDPAGNLTSDMLSLSLVPRSRWQNLLHLDLIRQRNKPTAPAEKPKQAPFFLSGSQAIQTGPTTETRVSVSKMESTAFAKYVKAAGSTNDYAQMLEELEQLSSSAADIEIRSLGSGELVTFVKALTWLAQRGKKFELGQTWMTVFLRVHGDIARNDTALRQAIREWSTETTKESQRVQQLAEYCGGLVSYLRAARV
ncbi:hypothetical protein AMS68_001276 [Peltaster fructicola]|uniref:Small-subunit processome Utp21 domain-containing protein n=1 Tax=Peltaster fructicola TaxID=286661 RepID=A0A6H0XMA5_9PEZI|nr:hypothetical protein AMS68_001276 [Peltaster fructicola]